MRPSGRTTGSTALLLYPVDRNEPVAPAERRVEGPRRSEPCDQRVAAKERVLADAGDAARHQRPARARRGPRGDPPPASPAIAGSPIPSPSKLASSPPPARYRTRVGRWGRSGGDEPAYDDDPTVRLHQHVVAGRAVGHRGDHHAVAVERRVQASGPRPGRPGDDDERDQRDTECD